MGNWREYTELRTRSSKAQEWNRSSCPLLLCPCPRIKSGTPWGGDTSFRVAPLMPKPP